MPGQLPPGIGTDQQAMQATAFVRQQPWYLSWIAARGKTPDSNGNVPLSDDERDQLRDLIVSKGIGLNHKYDGIDENGQIVEEHHKLRNTLIGAAIGGAALTGFGAAGMGPLSGLFGASTVITPAAAPTLEATMNAEAATPWLAGGGAAASETGASEGIPAAFGWNAVDTVGSSAPSAAAAAGGPVAAAGSSSSEGGLFSRLAQKYGLDAAKGVITGLFQNSANNKKLNFENSLQDPYRGQLFQSRDVAKLDQMANGNFVASPTSITGRYAHDYQPETPWMPSDTVRGVAAQNEASVAGGQSGQYHMGDDTLPAVNYKMPATSVLRAIMAARARGTQPAAPAGAPDSSAPWLA